MSFLLPMMRTRILNASRPLSRQVRAVHSTTPVSKPVAKLIAHNPALHCATCPFTAHERVHLKAPLTGGPSLPDDKLVKAIEKHYLTRAATPPTDYSGADSERNYNARTQSLEAARCERADLIKKLLIKQLAAKHEVSEREAKRVVRSLVHDVESVRERAQRRGRREKGRREEEQRKQWGRPEGAPLGVPWFGFWSWCSIVSVFGQSALYWIWGTSLVHLFESLWAKILDGSRS